MKILNLSNLIEKSSKLFLILFFCFLPLQIAQAAVPKLLTYQGVLKNASGNYLTGTYSIVFKIYSASTGGTALWTETQSSVSASSGKFSVQLGSVTALNLDFNVDYWLSIKVGSDAEMSPRIRLTSVGYGIRSDYETNGFTQAQHDALTHKSVEGVKDNAVNLAKTNFKLDAYSLAAANSMGDLVIDTFNDASGINAGSSSNYTWRGASYYDVVVAPAGIDASTKLVLHGNGTDASTTFTDSSNTPKTMTANGNAQIDTAQSKFGGASALFDGSGDYISTAAHSDFDFGTGDFTIDFWVRFSGALTNKRFYEHGGGAGGSAIHTNGTPDLVVDLASSSFIFAWGPSVNTWYHVAVTRSGTSLRAFINGTQIGSTQTSSDNVSNASIVTIGADNGGSVGLPGWIDEFRLIKGTAVWTANFTAPTQEYSSSGGTATVISNAFTEPVAPTEAIVTVDETLNSGTITYYVSRDNGTTWTQCTKETVTNISSQPSGTQLKWKAVITNNAELNAIAVTV